MKLLATYSNAGEAGVCQSLLASAGIETEMRDGRADVCSVPAVQLFVAEEHQAQAAALIAAQVAAEPDKHGPGRSHPAEGFPFLGITGLVAIIWSLLFLVRAIRGGAQVWGRWDTPRGFLELLAAGGAVLVYSLLVGAAVASLCLVVRFTWQKLRS